MNTNNLSSLLTVKDLKTIKVKLPGTNTIYTYKTIDTSIKVDEFVVISFNDALVKIARVMEIDSVPDLSKDLDYKWIVQKVDFTAYHELNKAEKVASDKLTELENKALVSNATKLLAERLNTGVNDIKKAINKD